MPKKESELSKPKPLSFEETPLAKRTPKKSSSIKRPTDLSWLQNQGLRFGKKMRHGNSKPSSDKTGLTLSESQLPSIFPTKEGVTWTTLPPQFLMQSLKPKSSKTTATNIYPQYGHSLGVTLQKPERKSLLKKPRYSLIDVMVVAILLSVAKYVEIHLQLHWH